MYGIKLGALALGAAMLVASASAGAQTTFYGTGTTPQANFTTAAGVTATNDLTGSTTPISFGALGTASISGGSAWSGLIEGTGAGAGSSAFTLTFSQALGAFGAGISDLGTCCGNSPFANGTVRFSFFNGLMGVGTFDQVFNTSAEAFFGVSGLGAFDRVEIYANSGDILYLEDLVVGAPTTAVPEPSTYALMASGLAGLGIAARRRRKS